MFIKSFEMELMLLSCKSLYNTVFKLFVNSFAMVPKKILSVESKDLGAGPLLAII